MALAALLLVVAYIVITINFVVTVVESYLVVSVGFIFLGFGGSRWTVPYLERYIGLAVSIGIKIILLYCLISAGLGLGNGWLAEAQGIGNSPHPSMTAFDVMGAALIFMMLCWQIPKLFAAVLGGAPALTGGDLVSTSLMVGSAGVAVATAAAAGIGGLAGGAAALGRTASAAGAGSSGGSGIAGAISATNSRTGGAAVSPPPSSGNTGSSARRQPDPPSAGPRAGSLSGLGGEPLAGSGFERETPARGFQSADTTGKFTAGEAAAPVSQPGASAGPSNDSNAAGNGQSHPRIPRVRKWLPALPSDAAPHATPPRMPIDHHE